MAKWLTPSASGKIYRNSAGRVYTGTAGVPVFFEDADVAGAIVDGWSYSATAPLEPEGKLIPLVANLATDPLTGKVAGIIEPKDGSVISLGGGAGVGGSYTSIVNAGVTQPIAQGSKVTSVLQSVSSDPSGWWDNTNKKFTPTKAGNYFVAATLQSASASASLQVSIYKNGVSAIAGEYQAPGSNVVSTVSGIVAMNGTTDYLEVYGYHSITANIGGVTSNNFANFTYLGPNSAPTTVPVYTTVPAGGLPEYLGQVATRCQFNSALVTGVQQGMFREFHYARDDISAMTLRWDDRYSGSELASGATTTIECAIEYPSGTYTRVTFSGTNQGVMASGGSIVSDPIAVAIPNGAMFWLRTWKANTAGMLGADTNPHVLTGFGEATQTGATVPNVVMGGAISSNATYLSTPSAILAMTKKPSLLLVGDSRVVGLKDLPATSRTGDSGEFARALGGSFGYICCAMSGESAQGFWGQGAVRRSLKQYTSHVICNYGINDLNSGGFNLAQMQTVYGNIWATLGAPAFPVYQATLPPMTTSTDSWATVANQTSLGAWEATRVATNNWIRTQGDIKLAGILDITLALESSKDSGKWMPGYVGPADGVHENATGAYAIVSSGAINPALIVRRP